MTTLENQIIKKPILAEIADKLLKAQQEIDELTVQMALGKAEAKDKFEEVKHDFKNRLAELKKVFLTVNQEEKLKAKIEALEQELACGKAETASAFEIQKNKILAKLNQIEEEVVKKVKSYPFSEDFLNDFEKFKLKLEILRLKFNLKKFEVRDSFRTSMNEAREKIHSLTQKAKAKMKLGKSKYSNFSDEILLAYKHMRKALSAL